MRVWFNSGQHTAWGQGTVAVLAAAFLFNPGQMVLRPTLYLLGRGQRGCRQGLVSARVSPLLNRKARQAGAEEEQPGHRKR